MYGGGFLKVFIGSSSEQLDNAKQVAIWLEDLNQEPILWTRVFPLGAYTLESLINISNLVDAAIFVFGDDDKIWFRNNTMMSVRDNILLEYGLFSGKLSRDKVVFLCKGDPKIASDLKGITFGNLDKPNNAEQLVANWINRIKSENIENNICCNVGEFHITDLYNAFQIVLGRNEAIDTLRVFAISTFKSVQMMRLKSNLNIKNARVLLRRYIENDFFYEESMKRIIDIAVDNWRTMVNKGNIFNLNLSFVNYHLDEGFYIIDDRYLICGFLNYDGISKRSEFADNVILFDNQTSAGVKWINCYIERFEKIYRNYEKDELLF